jgi:hypothetical protein
MQIVDLPNRLRGVDNLLCGLWSGLVSRRGVDVPFRDTVWASAVLNIIVDIEMILILYMLMLIS